MVDAWAQLDNNHFPADMNGEILRRIVTALAVLLAVYASVAAAQQWPQKPVRLVIPIAAGGNLDIVTRSIAQKLTEVYGQPMIVENRPGVNSVAGTEYVARAAADGYTFLMMASTFLTCWSGTTMIGSSP